MARSRANAQQDVLSWRLLRATGYVLVVQGICMLAIGLADVIYTAIEYTKAQKCVSAAKMESLNTLIDPCDNDDVLVYTWVASPVWSSFVVIACGAVGAALRTKYQRSKKQITAYLVLASITGCLLCPCTIVLSALEINAGKDVFVHGDASNLDVKDSAKFVLPLLSAILACLVAIVCVVLMFHILTSVKLSTSRDIYGTGRRYTHREKFQGKWSRKKKDKKRKKKEYGHSNEYDNRSFSPYHEPHTVQPRYSQQGDQRTPSYHAPYYASTEQGFRPAFPSMYPPNYSLPINKTSQYTRQDAAPRERRYPRKGTREPSGYYVSRPSSYNGSIPHGYGRKARNRNDTIDDMYDFRDVARVDRDSVWGRSSSRR